MLKTSKGVTPVVATVLLLFIAVGAVGSAAVFLDDTMTSIGESIEDDMALEDRRDSTGLRIEYGHKSTGSDEEVLLDVRNTGSESLEIRRDGTDLWNIYLSNRPIDDWEYMDSDIDGEELVYLNPNEVLSIDTSVEWPDEGESVELDVNAPYGSSDSITCFNDGGNTC